MTNNLHRRVFEHKTHRTEGFTDQYNATRLVYWQSFDDVYKAIRARKAIEGLATREEVVAHRTVQPGMEGPGRRLVEEHKVPRLALAVARDSARDDSS